MICVLAAGDHHRSDSPAGFRRVRGSPPAAAPKGRVRLRRHPRYPPSVHSARGVGCHPMLSSAPNPLLQPTGTSGLEARYAALVEGSIDAIVGLTRDGDVTSWNPAAADLYGYTEEEVLGRPVGALFSEARRHEAGELLVRLDADERVVHFETEHTRRDASIVEVSLSMSPIRDPNGEVVAASAIIRDISFRRRHEAELARTRAQLERHARDLERSNSDLEQFAYVASHDLAEPLRAVTGFLQLLQRRYAGQLDDTADRYIYRAVDGAARMRSLIDDLLTYSRAGRTPPEETDVDVAKVVERVIASLGPSISEAGAKIEADRLPTVRSDERQLTQLFQNLLSNALKFRGQRPPRIQVTAERDGRAWRFSVTDNGIGVEARHADRIFVPFKRLHSRDAYPGTGIGLGVCKKIVESQGGHIEVSPAPGEGARFTFTLPDRPEDADD